MKSLFFLLLTLYSLTQGYSQTSEEHYNRALAKYQQQDFQGALEEYTQTIQSNPRYKAAYDKRGQTKATLKDYQGAIEDYNRAIEINAVDARAYFNRGIAKIKSGQKESGCVDLNKAKELGEKDAQEAIQTHCH